MASLKRLALSVFALLGCGLAVAAGADPANGHRKILQTLSAFRTCASTITGLKLVYKGDAEYEQQRQRISNTRFINSKFPEVFGFPANATQASNLLKCATSNGIKVAARGGGHNYEALSMVNGGLVIDTGKMTNINIFKRNGEDVATVGAGQRIGPLNAQLWNNGKFVPTGVCDSVGIAGVASGGGIGPLLRQVGVTADSVVEAELVTAAGKVVTVSSQNNTDLYFAIRGGGGNFGLITSLTFKLRVPPPVVSLLHVRWPNTNSNMRDVLNAFFKWDPFNLAPEYSYVELFVGDAVRILVYYWGPRQDLQTLYGTNSVFKAGSGQSLEQLKGMTYDKFLEYMMNPWNNILLSQMTLDNVIKRAFDNQPGRPAYKASSAFLKTVLNATAVDNLVNNVLFPTRGRGWIQIHPMGGAPNSVAVTSTAFPHRDTKYQLQIYIYENNEAWIQSVQSAVKPAATGLQYLNYIDTDTANAWNTYFGPNAARLRTIKTTWDPTNVFDAIQQR